MCFNFNRLFFVVSGVAGEIASAYGSSLQSRGSLVAKFVDREHQLKCLHCEWFMFASTVTQFLFRQISFQKKDKNDLKKKSKALCRGFDSIRFVKIEVKDL